MPEKCETCDSCISKDRREDYGDVCMPFCEKLNKWLDFYEGEEAPCR